MDNVRSTNMAGCHRACHSHRYQLLLLIWILATSSLATDRWRLHGPSFLCSEIGMIQVYDSCSLNPSAFKKEEAISANSRFWMSRPDSLLIYSWNCDFCFSWCSTQPLSSILYRAMLNAFHVSRSNDVLLSPSDVVIIATGFLFRFMLFTT